MNTEFVQEWIEALESGKYEQGQQRLNSNHKFCCLGVACELLVEKGVLEKVEYPDILDDVGYRPIGNLSTSSATAALPREAARYIGINDWGAFVRKDHGSTDLATLNDSGQSFAQIAEVLREGLEEKSDVVFALPY